MATTATRSHSLDMLVGLQKETGFCKKKPMICKNYNNESLKCELIKNESASKGAEFEN